MARRRDDYEDLQYDDEEAGYEVVDDDDEGEGDDAGYDPRDRPRARGGPGRPRPARRARRAADEYDRRDAPYGVDPITGLPYSDKSKVVAGVLQIVLAGLGIGRFYTGHIGLGIAQLAVTIVTCGVGAIWGFIDGIIMLTGGVTDAEGRPLRP